MHNSPFISESSWTVNGKSPESCWKVIGVLTAAGKTDNLQKSLQLQEDSKLTEKFCLQK